MGSISRERRRLAPGVAAGALIVSLAFVPQALAGGLTGTAPALVDAVATAPTVAVSPVVAPNVAVPAVSEPTAPNAADAVEPAVTAGSAAAASVRKLPARIVERPALSAAVRRVHRAPLRTAVRSSASSVHAVKRAVATAPEHVRSAIVAGSAVSGARAVVAGIASRPAASRPAASREPVRTPSAHKPVAKPYLAALQTRAHAAHSRPQQARPTLPIRAAVKAPRANRTVSKRATPSAAASRTPVRLPLAPPAAPATPVPAAASAGTVGSGLVATAAAPFFVPRIGGRAPLSASPLLFRSLTLVLRLERPD